MLRFRRIRCVVLAAAIAFALTLELFAQNAAPAQWPTPAGSHAAVPVQPVVSAPQSFGEFLLKVRSDAIAGDVRPVVADIIPNPALAPSFPFAPLEIAAVVGGKLVVPYASGKATYRSAVPPFSQAISFVADSSLLPPAFHTRMPNLLLLDSTARDSLLLPSRDGSSDTLRIRWSCNGTCGRSDTAVILPSTRLVQAIVPNPVLRGQELCRIVTAPRQTDRITIRIFDGSDRLVRTLVHDDERSGGQIYCHVWDCRSDSSELVPPGVYYVLVQASSGWKSFEAVYVR
ncbi:MAG: hypothetical protein KatS3mg040_0200 [Candidatus Kapaibacterium sp.]|nr:MAG: hypothetical protein KatS3mg040_0200 [Candidatus Kapabacteria bacterium]